MRCRISQSHGFDKGMHAQACQNADRHAAMQMVGVAVLDTHRDHIEGNLGEKTDNDENSDKRIAECRAAILWMVEFRQQVEERQAEQIGPSKGVEELDIAGLIKAEQENAKRTQDDAGKEQKIIHTARP